MGLDGTRWDSTPTFLGFLLSDALGSGKNGALHPDESDLLHRGERYEDAPMTANPVERRYSGTATTIDDCHE